MTIAASARSLLVLVLLASAPAVAAPQTGGVELLPIPEPALESAERAVQEQLREERVSLEQIVGQGEADAKALGAAFGRMGQLYLANNFLASAEPCLLNAGTLLPEDFRWPYYLGALHVGQGELEKAMTQFERAVALAPRYVGGHIRLGRVLVEANRLDAAEQSFNRALELAPNSAGAQLGLGRISQARGDYDAAAEHFEAALALQPEAKAIHRELAMAYRQSGDMEKAREHLDRYEDVPLRLSDPLVESLQVMVAGAGVHFKRGVEALRGGDVDIAIRELDTAVEIEPTDAMAHHYLALALLRSWRAEQKPEQLDRALTELRLAVELDPDHRDAHFALATMSAQLDQPDDALHHFAEAHRIDPEDTEARLEWVIAMARAGQTERAAKEMDKLALSAPEYNKVLVTLVDRLVSLDQVDEAVARYQYLLELDPDNSEALVAAGALLARADRLAEAATYFDRLIALEPENAPAHLSRAMALILGGDYTQALSRLEQSVEALPDESALISLLARLLATCSQEAIRDGARAVELAFRAYRLAETPDNAETIAMALAEAGRFADAVRWQSRVVEEAVQSGESQASRIARQRLELYRASRPARNPWTGGAG
jgi:tetratricopeptide (TPR) repeat protein